MSARRAKSSSCAICRAHQRATVQMTYREFDEDGRTLTTVGMHAICLACAIATVSDIEHQLHPDDDPSHRRRPPMSDGLRLDLLRSYYEINRSTWPSMARRAALLDAWRLWRKTWRLGDA